MIDDRKLFPFSFYIFIEKLSVDLSLFVDPKWASSWLFRSFTSKITKSSTFIILIDKYIHGMMKISWNLTTHRLSYHVILTSILSQKYAILMFSVIVTQERERYQCFTRIEQMSSVSVLYWLLNHRKSKIY